MHSANSKTCSPELIKGVIREIQVELARPERPYGWLARICEKYGVKASTARGWLDRYKTPEGVPIRVPKALAKVDPEPVPGNGHATQLQPSAAVLDCDRCKKCSDLERQLKEIKLILADAYIESVRGKQS